MEPESNNTGSFDDDAFLTTVEQRERAFSRLKSTADRRRHYRVSSILSQEDESIFKTIGRIFFLSTCIIFDGLILPEIIIQLGKTVFAWAIFGIILSLTIFLQRKIYLDWFENHGG